MKHWIPVGGAPTCTCALLAGVRDTRQIGGAR